VGVQPGPWCAVTLHHLCPCGSEEQRMWGLDTCCRCAGLQHLLLLSRVSFHLRAMGPLAVLASWRTAGLWCCTTEWCGLLNGAPPSVG